MLRSPKCGPNNQMLVVHPHPPIHITALPVTCTRTRNISLDPKGRSMEKARGARTSTVKIQTGSMGNALRNFNQHSQVSPPCQA